MPLEHLNFLFNPLFITKSAKQKLYGLLPSLLTLNHRRPLPEGKPPQEIHATDKLIKKHCAFLSGKLNQNWKLAVASLCIKNCRLRSMQGFDGLVNMR